jgi:hypothetical protein
VKNKPTLNDESIPEEERIYSPSKREWCRKTSKESAEVLLKQIEQMKEDIKHRGIKPAVPPKEDWYIKCARAIPLKNNPDFKVDVHYIFDEKQGKYRMYTDDTKYGERKEIIFDNKKQCFTIKNLNKLRKKWNKAHKDKVKGDEDEDFNKFIKEKF